MKEKQNNISTFLWEVTNHVRIRLVSIALESVKVVYGLRIQQSRLVNDNSIPCFQSLVGE